MIKTIRAALVLGLALIAAAPAVAQERFSETIEGQVYRVNFTAGTGWPSGLTDFLTQPPHTGEWAMLYYWLPGLPGDDIQADVSFGHVVWSFEDGAVVGQIEVPASELSIEFRMTLASAVGEQLVRVSVTYEPPPGFEFFYVAGISALSEPARIETGFRLEAEAPILQTLEFTSNSTMVKLLLGTNDIILGFATFSDMLRQPDLHIYKGETGQAIFDEAFAAWGLAP